MDWTVQFKSHEQNPHEIYLAEYRSTVDTSDELWQASSIRGTNVSDLCMDRSEVYKVHVCWTDTWQIHIYIFCSFVSSKAQVDSGGVHSLCTSESMGQNMPAQIRGVEYLGHWIPWSDVRQIAVQTRPNPRYGGIGPFSEVPNVRGIDGRVYAIDSPFNTWLGESHLLTDYTP